MTHRQKFTDKVELTKVQVGGNKSIFLDVDTNGRLVVNTKVANTGGIHVQGASSVSTFAGNVIVDGNLTVSGTSTIVNTTELDIEDNIITLNKGETGPGVSEGKSGIRIERGDGTTAGQEYAGMIWDESDNSWDFNGLTGTILPTDPIIKNVGHPPSDSPLDSNTVATQGYVDRYLAEATVVFSTSDADIVLTEAQCKYRALVVADLNPYFTQSRNIVYPDVVVMAPQAVIYFAGAYPLGVKKVSGAVVFQIEPGHISMVSHNGDVLDATVHSNASVGRKYIDFTSDADMQFDMVALGYHEIFVTDTGLLLTADRELQLGASSPEHDISFQVIHNNTLFNVRYCRLPGNGVLIPPGESRFVRLDYDTYEFVEAVLSNDVPYDPTYVNSIPAFIGSISETNTKDLLDRMVVGNWGVRLNNFSSSDITLTEFQAGASTQLAIGSPGTNYRANSFNIISGGTGYTLNDVITVTGGTSEAVLTLTVDGIGGGGDITSVILDITGTTTAGIYSIVPSNPVSVTGGTGTLATFDILWDEHYRSLIFPNTAVIPGFACALTLCSKPFKIHRVGTSYSNSHTIYPNAFYNIIDYGYGVVPLQISCNSSVATNTVYFWQDADMQLGSALEFFRIIIEDTAPVLTAPRDINYLSTSPALSSGVQEVTNNTAQTITYKANSNTGVLIPAGESRVVYLNAAGDFEEMRAGNLKLSDAGGDTTTWPLLATSQTGHSAPSTDGGLTYNASTNTLTTTTFSGALSGNATTATDATNVVIGSIDGNTSDTTLYPMFVAANTATAQQAHIDEASISYNASTNTLTTTTFSGALSGNATTATTSTNVTISTTDGNTSDSTLYPVFVAANTATDQLPHTDVAGITYDASTNTLSTSVYSGILKPLAGTATANTAPLEFTSGTLLTAPEAGAVEYDAVQLYGTIDTTSGRGIVPVEQYFQLTANGSTISTIANMYGTTSNIALVANATYEIEINFYYLNTTAGTVDFTFTNSAAPANQNIHVVTSETAGVTAFPGAAAYLESDVVNDTSATLTLTTVTVADAVNHYFTAKIQLQNGTGTSLTLKATKNVGGTITPLRGSYWRCRRMPTGNVGTFVA